MTFEEKWTLLEAGMAAEDRGDNELAERIYDQIPLAPVMGRGLAETIGYKNAVALGTNFSEVDEAYGTDWHNGL